MSIVVGRQACVWAAGKIVLAILALPSLAVSLRADDPAAKEELTRAASLQQQRQYREAIQAYESALKSAPNSLAGHNDLAWLLATCPTAELRNAKEAVRHATLACEATQWKNPSALDTLAVALAEDQQFDKAIE